MSQIDRYLDELFDRLAGTGAAGRRTLAEVETHLHEAVDGLVESGVAPADAEREAIRRFGPPPTVAAAIRRAHGGGLLANVAAVWLFVGLITGAVAIGSFASAASVAYLAWRDESGTRCVGDCYQSGAMNANLDRGVFLAVCAMVAISAWFTIIKRWPLAQAGRRFPYRAGAVLIAVGLAILAGTAGSQDLVVLAPQPGLKPGLFVAAAVALMGVGVIAWGAGRSRRSWPPAGRDPTAE